MITGRGWFACYRTHEERIWFLLRLQRAVAEAVPYAGKIAVLLSASHEEEDLTGQRTCPAILDQCQAGAAGFPLKVERVRSVVWSRKSGQP